MHSILYYNFVLFYVIWFQKNCLLIYSVVSWRPLISLEVYELGILNLLEVLLMIFFVPRVMALNHLASSQLIHGLLYCPCLCCYLFLWYMYYVVFLNSSQFVQVCCCLFIYVLPWRSNYQERGVWIPLTGLTLPHICACPMPGPGFLMSYVVILLMFSELRWEVIVHFVDIGGIIDHHSCLNFFFHKKVASLLKFWCVFIHLKTK